MRSIAELEALLRKFEEALNEEIENEMRHVITYSGHLTCILKCMGIVCFYDRNGTLPDPPVSARRLLQLEDMDRTFYSLSDHPLKIIRNPDGSFTEVRDW